MKQDHKRLSKEKHEIAYVRKLARRILKHIGTKNPKDGAFYTYEFCFPKSEVAALRRICKAVLKFAK